MIKHILIQEVFDDKKDKRIESTLELKLPFILKKGMEIEQEYYEKMGKVSYSKVVIDKDKFEYIYTFMKPIHKENLDEESEKKIFEEYGWKIS